MGQSQEREIAPGCKSSQARSRQDERPSSAWSIEAADYWQLEGCRQIWSDRQRPGSGPGKELWQHQCLVPLHGEGSEGNQESRAGPVCLGIMKGSGNLRTGERWMPAPDYGRSLKALTINLLVRAMDKALQFQREVLRVNVVYSDAD